MNEMMLRRIIQRHAWFVLIAVGMAAPLWGGTHQFQKAVVVRVENHRDASPPHRFPGNEPLRPSDYAYDISIRLNCLVYVSRYESATDYLPADFSPGHSVDVSVQKHLIYVRVHGNDEFKMSTVRRYSAPRDSCAAVSDRP